MKHKIVFILTMFFSISTVWGDTSTGGDIGLIRPTTGVADLKRSWADKYNDNFTVIAATVTDIRTRLDAVATSTSQFALETSVADSTSGIVSRADKVALATTQINTANILGGASTFASFNGVVVATTALESGSLFNASIIVSTHIADGSITVQKLSGGGTIFASFDGTSASTASLFAGGATSYVDLSGSTDTKRGSLTLEGRLNVNFIEIQSADALAIGSNTANFKLAIGNEANSTGNESVAIGNQTTANNTNNVAIGKSAKATGIGSLAIGNLANSNSGGGISIGTGSVSSDQRAIALGSDADGIGIDSIAIGHRANSGAQNTIAIGFSASASGGSSVAIGENSENSGTGAIAIGSATATGTYSIGIGAGASATGANSLALGNNVQTTVNNEFAIGRDITVKISSGLRITGLTSQGTVGTDASGNLIAGTGGGGSASTNTYASITIGVTSDQGVDVVGNDENAFWTALRRINYVGEIRVRNGNYIVGEAGLPNGVTVPASVEIIFESSANVHNNGNNTIFTSSGIIRNLKLNISNGSMDVPAVKLRSSAKLYNTINEQLRIGATSISKGIYEIDTSSNIIVDGMLTRINVSTINGAPTTVRPTRFHIRNSSDVLFNNIRDEQVPSVSLGGSISDSVFAFDGRVINFSLTNSKINTMGNFLSGQNVTRLSGLKFKNLELNVYGTNGINSYFEFNYTGSMSSGTVFDDIVVKFKPLADPADNGSAISRFFEFVTGSASNVELNNIKIINERSDVPVTFMTAFLFQSGGIVRQTTLQNCTVIGATNLVDNQSSATSRIGYNVLFNGQLQTASPNP